MLNILIVYIEKKYMLSLLLYILKTLKFFIDVGA